MGTANFNYNYGINRKNQNFSLKSLKKILNFAYKNKIKNIDTASVYSGVEKKLGKLNLNKFKISSKLKKIPNNCKNIKKRIFNEINDSINNLNVKKIEHFFLHHPQDLINKKTKYEVYKSLTQAKKLGLIKKIGISIYSFQELNKIINKFKVDIVQIPYSLFDRRFEIIMRKLRNKKIHIQARSIFLQGLLLSDYNDLPKKFLKFNHLKKFENWIKKNKITRIQAAVSFVKQMKLIDSYVIGFNNLQQLKEIYLLFKTKNKKFPKNISSNNINLIDPRKWKKI